MTPRRRPLGDCGCVLVLGESVHDDQRIDYCPRHLPAWRAAVEAVMRGRTPDHPPAPPQGNAAQEDDDDASLYGDAKRGLYDGL